MSELCVLVHRPSCALHLEWHDAPEKMGSRKISPAHWAAPSRRAVTRYVSCACMARHAGASRELAERVVPSAPGGAPPLHTMVVIRSVPHASIPCPRAGQRRPKVSVRSRVPNPIPGSRASSQRSGCRSIGLVGARRAEADTGVCARRRRAAPLLPSGCPRNIVLGPLNRPRAQNGHGLFVGAARKSSLWTGWVGEAGSRARG